MTYKLIPDAVPTEYVLAIVSLADNQPIGILTSAGPATEGAEFIYLPIEPMPVPLALQIGAAAAREASKPLFIRLDGGAEWNADWGDAPTA